MSFAEVFARGILKSAYSAEWMKERRERVRKFNQGKITRQELIQDASKIHNKQPFEDPENFLQAYYNIHFWSNRAKVLGDRSLYKKKDEAIVRALRHLNFQGIRPIRPKGHPNLLEIQVPSHKVLLHTYSPMIKQLLKEEGYKLPVRKSPSEKYLQEGREIARRKRVDAVPATP